MTLKMYELLGAIGVLGMIRDQKMPAKTAYKITKLGEAIGKETQYYNDEREKLVDEYAEKDEGGNYIFTDETQQMIKVAEDKLAECNQKITELMNLDVDLTVKPITFDELDAIELSIDELKPLMPFIEEE